MNNTAAHSQLKAEILLAHGARPGMRLFNNPVGEGWVGKPIHQDRESITILHPRRVAFGLHPGSPDLFGWRTVTITPDMVGQLIAQVWAPEVKTGTGRPRLDQANFIAKLSAAGGLTGIVRSVQDVSDQIEGRWLL